MYIQTLRDAEPPIIPPERLERFMMDVFHNFAELHAHHRRLVDALHVIQREEHPRIRSIIATVLDAALNFRDAYLEYIPNYPIAAYRLDEEMNINLAFRAFVEVSTAFISETVCSDLLFPLHRAVADTLTLTGRQ